MKITVERDRLKDALAVVIGRTKGASIIPILSHILVEAKGNLLTLTGHDLESCSQVSIAAEVETASSFAMPGDRFNRLIAGLPNGSQVVISADDKNAKVKCGRSSYQFMVLPASDFPGVLEVQDPVELTLSAKQIARLFKTPAPFISQTKDRYYLRGIYLHTVKDKLAACATDGHTLLRTCVEIKPPKFDGVIVPDAACDELVRAAGDAEEVTLQISRSLIAIAAGERRFVSKLIDGNFPADYERLIPQTTAPAMTTDAEDMSAALARLMAACDPERLPAVRLSWDGKAEQIKAELHTAFGEGDEAIDCNCDGRPPGEIGVQISYLDKLIDALGGEIVTFYINGHDEPLRLENPADTDIVTVVMPCRV